MPTDFKEEYNRRSRDYANADIATIESGHKVWWPSQAHGYLTADSLRLIADYLDELNAEWNATKEQLLTFCKGILALEKESQTAC